MFSLRGIRFQAIFLVVIVSLNSARTHHQVFDRLLRVSREAYCFDGRCAVGVEQFEQFAVSLRTRTLQPYSPTAGTQQMDFCNF